MSPETAKAPMLEAQGLNVLYGDYQILWDVSFHAPEGEVIAILGPNGSGKSTLMNTLSGVLRSRTGAISFRGARIDGLPPHKIVGQDRKSTRLNSSHDQISYAVFCLKK